MQNYGYGAGTPPQPPPGSQPPGVQMPPPGAAPAAQGAAPSAIGFELVANERVLFARRPSGQLGALYALGVLLSFIFVGLILLIVASAKEKEQRRLIVITTHRLVVLNGQGQPTSFWFQNFRDVDPIRRDVNVGGGGLIGFAISQAVTAAANSSLNKQHKLQPSYWTRTMALEFLQHDGRKVRADLGMEGEAVAIQVAQIFLANAGHGMPTYETRYLPPPPPPGTALQILGVLIGLYSAGFIFSVRRNIMVFVHALAGTTGVVVGCLGVVGGIALFAVGSMSKAKARSASGTPSTPAVPIGVFGGLITAASVAAIVMGPKEYTGGSFSSSSSHSSYSSSTSTGSGLSGSMSTGSGSALQAGKPLLKAADVVAAYSSLGLNEGTPAAYDDFYSSVGVNHVSAYPKLGADPINIDVWDLSSDVTKGTNSKACSLQPKFAVCVSVDAKDSVKLARSLADDLAKRPLSGGKAPLQNALRAAGITGMDWSTISNTSLQGVASDAFGAKKGTQDIMVYLLDFAEAIDHPEPDVKFAIDGKYIFRVATYHSGTNLQPIFDALRGKK